GSSHAAKTFRAQDPIVVDDFAGNDAFADSRHLTEVGLASGVATPVRGDERPVGVLVAHSAAPSAFTADDVVFLLARADALAVLTARERAAESPRRSEE